MVQVTSYLGVFEEMKKILMIFFIDLPACAFAESKSLVKHSSLYY